MQLSQRNQFSGTGDLTLQAGDPAHKMLLIHAGAVSVDYVLLSESGTQWEAGSGTLAVGGGFLRDTVTSNYLGTTAKVDFDVGLHLVLIDEVDSGGGGAVAAEDVSYDNGTSGLAATDVQAAIDELAAASGGASLGLSVALRNGIVRN